MSVHSAALEAIKAAKIAGAEAAEASQVQLALHQLAEDPEVGTGTKGEATLIYRELAATPGKTQVREELHRKAIALANRTS